ncbi:SAC3 domain-containing protein 1-like [Chiloscyllium plagiosum]|uniref:SAC3 domain-containing protein 1-like n=1 Tax=Chiloscyllium plagiosum TaxID=36176 RepID=UPI001CB80481|nr:SAC3 domain-containing protein 1-like [Chiloscyllium plagiosum]XP_043577445.1 SAC3 domain-containing protein 1-like [Chiloscyllium plagiosum]XP_043577446.1 SAC3 domain-containing protein 1-like [Chiloscyllium plagiosum]XP_043577447.1 SAC3 domain-containing protein 1-like [Chiloscyllium plagiosum]
MMSVRFAEPDVVLTGTCPGMCPDRERDERQRQKRLHKFEILEGTVRDRLPSADPRRIVKEYSRPAAGKEPAQQYELRPASVLLKTVHYLIDEIVPRHEEPWVEVYDYVFDRLRSVRQDMTIQKVSGPIAVTILEKSLRFFLCASYWLCEEPIQVFDPKMNDIHVQECFSLLLANYSAGIYENEAEFQALAILYNLGSVKALQHALLLPHHIRDSPDMKLAFGMNRAFAEGNYVRCLRRAGSLSFLQSCAIYRHIQQFRHHLLRVFNHGYSSRNCRYPLQRLANLLGMDSIPSAAELCQRHNLEVTGTSVCFQKSCYRDFGPGTRQRELGLVSKKQGSKSKSSIIHGD